MQEEAQVEGDHVRLETFGPRLFVREKGSEAMPGQVILPAGTRLGAVDLAILAQLGETHPLVIPAPSVRHVATGGELVGPDEIPGPGKIRDTNTSLLLALLEQSGVRAFSSTRVADDPAAITEAAEGPEDLLLLSGGASVGDYDFGASSLRRAGWTIHFDRVNLRPGKPLTFATRGTQAAFVIPGNPVSHYVCYQMAIRLAVECAAGRPPSWPALWVELEEAGVLSPDPRETWWPASALVSDGRLVVRPKPWSSSGNTFSLTGTNALVQVNANSPCDGKVLTLLLEPPLTGS
jgi:molybdopterin molybdotransferase